MTHRMFFVLATVVLLSGATGRPSVGEVRREQTDRRPTVTEVGEPYSISMATLQREAEKISDLRDFIIRNGYPDYAEVQEVAPRWPWESYEVRLYYMHWNLEVDFGHVLFSNALTDLGVEKFQGEIAPEKRHEIDIILQARQTPPAAEAPIAPPMAPAGATEPAAVVPQPPTSGLEALVARLEAAAERASRAADSAVEQSEAAVHAADRTVNIVDQLESAREFSRTAR